MIVDIDKITVGNRIRKDFGAIEELANDIRENGLINPPVINKSFELLAGERRLRACKHLGWPTIEVRMMDTRDAEHELNIEISENDVRKDFTKSERVDYMKRLLRIEQVKAEERKKAGTSVANATEVGRSDEITAKQFDISAKTMRREMAIVDNRDLLDPADFAEWDEGKLSTNKTYQRLKAAQRQAERERDTAMQDLEDAFKANEAMQDEVDKLQQQLAQKPKPEVIEREVVREVVPDDYEATKRRVDGLKRENERLNREYHDMWEQKRELDKKLEQANELLGERERDNGANRDIEQFINSIYSFLNRYGGKSRMFDQYYRVDETTQQECRKSLVALCGFAQNALSMTEDNRLTGD